jgi:uncharacterized protein (DUF433 family)
MNTPTPFVPTAEAAFIAGISDRDMNRVVDEHILPDTLLLLRDGRLFSRLAAAFARFYFGTEKVFVADFRRQVVTELTTRLATRADRYFVLALPEAMPKDLNWNIDRDHAQIDVAVFVQEAWTRVRQVERASSLVTTAPDVLAGEAVFAGTRVPIEIIVSSLDKGIDKRRLVSSYPFLTDAHIDAAHVFSRIHPKRGRPRRIADVHPEWTPKSSRLVRAAAKA